MHVDPFIRPEIAEIICGGVEKLMVRGVSHRKAVRRIARKHGVPPRHVGALIAREDESREVGL
jgi:hypothetical protein